MKREDEIVDLLKQIRSILVGAFAFAAGIMFGKLATAVITLFL